MKEQLNKLASSFPYLGLILILAGLVTWMITRIFDLIPNALVIAGVILLGLFVYLRPHDVRNLLGRRSARYGTSSLLSTLFLLTIGIILYWLAYQNPDWRVDLTETSDFTALPETVELLENLESPIHVIGFYTAQSARQQAQAESSLENLAAVSNNFSYEFKDPELFPLEAEQYDLNFDGTLIFTKGDGVGFTFSKASTGSDRDIHTALIKVVNPVTKKLYLLTGHGEFDKDSFEEFGLATAIAFIEDSGFTVENLNLFSAGAIPDDATVVAIINQEAPLTPEEVAALQAYLQAGGSAFITRDAIVTEGNARAEADGLNDMLLTDWGATIRND
ncbi:MAG: GldG family protein, partial [Methylococcales bacterium]|nr:GldG family protein [Methylococcales bacterium]